MTSTINQSENGYVPDFSFPYLLIGSGKLSKHLSYYFSRLGIPFLRWSRKHSSSEDLYEMAPNARAVLLAVRDDAIEGLYRSLPRITEQTFVHFSGSRVIDGVVGCHPLASFTDVLLDEELYQEIPFVCEKGVNFSRLFPELPNPWFIIEKDTRPEYHALLALAATTSYVAWNELSRFFESHSMPVQDLATFFKTVHSNMVPGQLVQASGPIARGDVETSEMNLASLNRESLQKIYSGLIDYYEDKLKVGQR